MNPLNPVNCNQCNQKFPKQELRSVQCSHVFCAPCVVDVALTAMKNTKHESFCPTCSKPFKLMPKENKISFDLISEEKKSINNHNGSEIAIEPKEPKSPLEALTDLIAIWPKAANYYTDEFIKTLEEIENAYRANQFSKDECHQMTTVLKFDLSSPENIRFTDKQQKYIDYIITLINIKLPKDVVNHPSFHANCLKFDSSNIRNYVNQILENAHRNNPSDFIYFLRPRSSIVQGNANHQHFVLSHISDHGQVKNLPITFDSESEKWFAADDQGNLVIHSTLDDFLNAALNNLNATNAKILPLTRSEIYKYIETNESQTSECKDIKPKPFEQLFEEIRTTNANWLVTRYPDPYRNNFQSYLEAVIAAYFAKELSPDDLKQLKTMLETFKNNVTKDSNIPAKKQADYDWFNIHSIIGTYPKSPALLGIDQVQWEYLNFALNLFSPNLPSEVLNHESFHLDCLTIDPSKSRVYAANLVREEQKNSPSQYIYLLRHSSSGRGNTFVQKFTLTYCNPEGIVSCSRLAYNTASDEWIIYGVTDKNDEVLQKTSKCTLDEFIIETIKLYNPNAENIKPLTYRHERYTSSVNTNH